MVKNAGGDYLTNKEGYTLYVKTADMSNTKLVSSCDATCEKNWPPFLLGDNEAGPDKSSDPLLSKLNLFKRADGKLQYALGNTLLYKYAGDKNPGDVRGTSVVGWSVAKP